MKTNPPNQPNKGRGLKPGERLEIEGEATKKVDLCQYTDLMLKSLKADVAALIIIKNDAVGVAVSVPDTTTRETAGEIGRCLNEAIKDYIKRKIDEKQKGGN